MLAANELKQKYKSNASFKKQMDELSENYKIMRQQAQYSSHRQIDKRLISKFETERSPLDIYFYYAAYADTKSLEKLTMHFIMEIPMPKNPFSIVYFNDQDMSSNKFSAFKNLLILLPIEYFLHMQQIYVVRGSLKSRASKYFSFHTMTKYLNNLTIDVSTVEELSEALKLEPQEIYSFMPKEIRFSFSEEGEQISSVGFAEALKDVITASTPATNLPKPADRDMSKSSPSGGRTSMKSLPRIQIDEYEKSERGLPQVLELLIFYFREHPEGLADEGIFRKSVNIDEENHALSELAKKNYRFLDSVTNSYLVASLIKKFFAHLATPVIPFQQFDKLMAGNRNTQLVSSILKEIQQDNLTKLLSLMLLLQFLRQQVIPQQAKNKMTQENIAICFGPCLMWCRTRSIQDIVFANKSVQVVMVMLEEFEQVFGSRKRQKALYRNSYVAHTKKSMVQGLMEYQSSDKSETVNILDNRLTPNFGQLILKNTETFLDLLTEEEDEVSEETVKLPPHQSQNFKSMVKQNEKANAHRKMIKVEEQSNYLKPPPRRGIFSSKIGGGGKSAEKDSTGSHKKSESSIQSIHSDDNE